MAITFSCEICGQEFRLRDDAAGKTFKCKGCGTRLSVPDADAGDAYGDPEEDYAPPPPRRLSDSSHSRLRPGKSRESSGSGSSTLDPGTQRMITLLVRIVSGLVVVSGLVWLVVGVKMAFSTKPDKEYFHMYLPLRVCVFVGIPAGVICRMGVKFGARSREIRMRGLGRFAIGVGINILGALGNLLLVVILPCFVFLWFGIFVVGVGYMIAGTVMMVTGSTEGIESLLGKQSE